jgi:two-component system, response regulator
MSKFTDILLVEDDPGDVRLALAVFGELHMAERCVVVDHGEDAMDFLKGRGRFSQRAPGPPKLVLVDLKMPRVNGFELLQQIRSERELGQVPVVVLTSSREERDVQRAYDLGANGYVVKGIDFADYRATLQALAKYWGNVNERPPGFVERRLSPTPRLAREGRRGAAAATLNPWLWPLRPRGSFA